MYDPIKMNRAGHAYIVLFKVLVCMIRGHDKFRTKPYKYQKRHVVLVSDMDPATALNYNNSRFLRRQHFADSAYTALLIYVPLCLNLCVQRDTSPRPMCDVNVQ